MYFFIGNFIYISENEIYGAYNKPTKKYNSSLNEYVNLVVEILKYI